MTVSNQMLRRFRSEDLNQQVRKAIEATTLADAIGIVEDVRTRGEAGARKHAERLGDLQPGQDIVVERPLLEEALLQLAPEDHALLERVTNRIRRFAEAQRRCLQPLDIEVEGGRAGHRWIPAANVGAYAPGGRYPLPSSVLMTVIPARVAGVESIWVASPKPAPITLAAAALAGADGLLAIGGAQAIAALAFGTFGPPSDVVVGPGNRWVTAAKKHLVGEIGIDGLAGPSELLVIADETAKASLIAADLIAQAEHDIDATPILVTTSADLLDSVDAQLAIQLADLPTRRTAAAAIERNGIAVLARDLDEAIAVSDRLAPEHLELHVSNPSEVAERVQCYGGLFLGANSAEVFGDYGAGPNHVLPTGGGGRFQAGLSVMTFLRPSTWLETREPELLATDSARLARLEGLEAHARASNRDG
ncbi:MAG: histidinol dehydrogenase [Planctomycetota bacterium]|jgi:histidinol dehydrogenase